MAMIKYRELLQWLQKNHLTHVNETGGKNNNEKNDLGKFPGQNLQLWLAGATDRCAETLLELVDATFGINKLLLSSEERMRIRSDTNGNDGVFHAIDHFFAIR